MFLDDQSEDGMENDEEEAVFDEGVIAKPGWELEDLGFEGCDVIDEDRVDDQEMMTEDSEFCSAVLRRQLDTLCWALEARPRERSEDSGTRSAV